MTAPQRIVVVTGAGRGIGFGIAEAFAKAGDHTIIGELDSARGEQAADRLRAQGFAADAIQLDVTQPDSCAALAARVMEQYRRIDVLVNNAGLFILHKSEDTPEHDWRLQLDVMLNGVFFMTQAVARAAMIPQQRGCVVNIASIGGMGGWPMRAAYNTAKAGVIVLTEVLATEWGHYNIRLNCVSPGVTRTEMLDVAIKQGVASLDKYEVRSPAGRVAEVSEIGDAVLFLASEHANFITGANLRVDGGWVASAGLVGARGYPEADTNG